MSSRHYRFPLVAIICLTISIESVFAERPCHEVIGELNSKYAGPLACARKNCPDFKIIYSGSAVDDACAQGCGDGDDGEMNVTEPELVRCKGEFRSLDEQDFFRIAWCLVGSKATALVVEPFMRCGMREKCSGKDVWGSSECLDQCRKEAQQLVEVATTTMERCGGLGQTQKALCAMFQKTINVCFIPEQCDRLMNILKANCPHLMKTNASEYGNKNEQ